LFALLIGGFTATGNWADNRWGLLKDVQAPGWASNPSRLGEIVVAPVEPKFVMSDWERVRRSQDADGFILAWIASHVRPRHPKTLS